jgi:Rrf2 family protein
MKLSKRGEYALRALIDMGIAHEMGRPLVQIGDLAETERLPIKFLEQILMQLKEAGFVESRRGKLGGYQLAMPAKKIKIGPVVRLIDGPLAPVSCASLTAYEKCSCPDEERCGLRMLMQDVRNAIANILDKFTLEDTVKMAMRKIRRDKAPIPFIESLLQKEQSEAKKARAARTSRTHHSAKPKASAAPKALKPSAKRR